VKRTIPLQLKDTPSSALYQAESKVYPRDVQGRFDTLRRVAVFVLLGIYYGFPWLEWSGRQAVLFDLPARRFYVFGLAFWPQDFVFLALLLILAAISLFFFTALAGRLWCGYACPQTVWTEVFVWVERRFEGDRARRMKLDAAAWTSEKFLRKGSKHLAWFVLAAWTGFTFVGFFTPIRDLTARLPSLQWSGWETFWVLFYGLATWGNAGILREQVCKYMCPYARFQGAMFDRDSLIIAYDLRRGEARGARRRGLGSVAERLRGLLPLATAERWIAHALPSAASAAGGVQRSTGAFDDYARDAVTAPPETAELGDCIDCTWCVQVCPVGIDIRNGLQYECIACGACIDACDQVMDRVGYPRGLVRYTTQNALDGRPARVLRPRIVIYGLLLMGLAAGWAWGVSHRASLGVEVLRDRNALYRVASDGHVENAYTLKLINKSSTTQSYLIDVADTQGPQLRGGPLRIELTAESLQTVAVTLVAPATWAQGRRDVQLVIGNPALPSRQSRIDTSFFGPAP